MQDLTPTDYSGEYPGTVTFCQYDRATFINSWLWERTPLNYKILPEHAGHQTVLQVQTGNGQDMSVVTQILAERQSTGTIEFWASLEGGTGVAGPVMGYWNGASIQWGFLFLVWSNGTLTLLDAEGTPQEFFGVVDSGTWHHFQVDYAQAGASYLGLQDNQFRLTVDKCAAWVFPFPQLPAFNVVGFVTGSFDPTNNSTLYLDAVGFSWDPRYHPGDNLCVSGPPPVPEVTIDVGNASAALVFYPPDFIPPTDPSFALYCNGSFMAGGIWGPGDRLEWGLSYLHPGNYYFELVTSDDLGGGSGAPSSYT